ERRLLRVGFERRVVAAVEPARGAEAFARELAAADAPCVEQRRIGRLRNGGGGQDQDGGGAADHPGTTTRRCPAVRARSRAPRRRRPQKSWPDPWTRT